MADTTIISLGGSIIVPDQVDTAFLSAFRRLILEKVSEGSRFVIICGGGGTNKRYNAAAREILPDIDDLSLDLIGISVTKTNAVFIRTLFGDSAHERLMDNPTKKIITKKNILIGCAWKPGCSTDKDAVLAAKTFNVDTVINLSNIDYLYDKNPKRFLDAKRIERTDWKELRRLVGDKWSPKLDFPFDPEAAALAQKLKLKVIIAKGTDVENLRDILEGKKFKGSVIE